MRQRYLLDTHALIWVHVDRQRLGARLLAQVARDEVELLFSPVSIWEIAIKAALRRPDFPVDPERVLAASHEAGLIEVPVTSEIACRVADLPLHHRDPFDRLLIAQAMALPALFCTADRVLAAYGDLVSLIP